MSSRSHPEGLAIARQLIAREAVEKTGFLDLGRLGLVEPPEELFDLKFLRRLNLGGFWWSDEDQDWHEARHSISSNRIGPEWSALERLAALESLECFMAQLTSLKPLAKLTALTSLNCAHTLVDDLNPLRNLTSLTSLTSLNISNTLINDLKPLKNLTSLTSLDCSGTTVTDVEPLEKLTKLTALRCSDTMVSDLKPLAKLTALTLLDIAMTEVKDLKPLKDLVGLTTLYCFETHVSDLRPLENLISLNSLFCFDTHVSDLGSLERLTALTCLYCSDTQVSDLGPLEKLTALIALDCSGTNVRDLKPLEKITTLTSVSCFRTSASDLKPLEKLAALSSLDCSGTIISDLKPLEKLTSLASLNCSGTQVNDLKRLAGLTAVSLLDCSETKVCDLNPLEKLNALESLNCSRTHIRELPDWLIWRDSLTKLYVHDVALSGLPKEVLSPNEYTSCLEQLRAHLADLKDGDDDLPDVKLVVIGNGRIGKTQICRRLRGEDYDAGVDSTHGIMVTSAPLPSDPPAHLHLWDFGGQDLYHGTHALFMKTRAIFVLVWTPSAENAETHAHGGMTFRNQPLSYWLSYVRHLGGTDSPVLIVQNQCDAPADELLHPPLETAALDGFGFRKVLHYSAKLDRGRAALDEALRDAIGWLREKHGSARIGKGRLAVKRRLEVMRDEDARLAVVERRHRTITQEHFQELCEAEKGISSPPMLLDYLHHCGIVFYQKGLFGDRIVLDQAWALEAVYAVFNREKCFKQLQQLQGRFTRTLLEALVWQEFSVEEQKLFLSLMQSCGICFIHRHGTPDEKVETEHIAPDLLPEREAVAGEIEARWPAGTACEEIVIEYPFLHAGMVRSVIARVGREAGMNALYWKEGVCGYERTTRSHLLLEVRSQTSERSPYGGQLVVRTTGPQAAELLRRVEAWIQHEEGRLGTSPHRKASAKPPRPAVETDEAVKTEPKLEFDTPPRSGTTYCVSYAWRDDSIQVVDDLCAKAEASGIHVLRDTTDLGIGEEISRFMSRLAAGDRVFVILSEKYLRSTYCMAELFEIWINCRQKVEEFRQHIRVYRLDDAKISTVADRVRHGVYWKKQFEEIDAMVREHGPSVIGATDLRQYKLMHSFAHNVSDILALIADTLLPKDFDQLVVHGFNE